jgi:hypothetical protein
MPRVALIVRTRTQGSGVPPQPWAVLRNPFGIGGTARVSSFWFWVSGFRLPAWARRAAARCFHVRTRNGRGLRTATAQTAGTPPDCGLGISDCGLNGNGNGTADERGWTQIGIGKGDGMYGVSHQKAGLNWAGKYRRWSRERALADLVARFQHKDSKTQRHEEQTGPGHCGFQIADCGLRIEQQRRTAIWQNAGQDGRRTATPPRSPLGKRGRNGNGGPNPLAPFPWREGGTAAAVCKQKQRRPRAPNSTAQGEIGTGSQQQTEAARGTHGPGGTPGPRTATGRAARPETKRPRSAAGPIIVNLAS